MTWKVFVPCDSRGGEPHLKLPIMTDCFTAVVAIHKEGRPSLIRGPWPPCVGVLQTCSASQLIYINIQSAVSLLLLLRLLSLYQLAYACLHSLAILPPSAPRSLLTTRREEGAGVGVGLGWNHLTGTFPQTHATNLGGNSSSSPVSSNSCQMIHIKVTHWASMVKIQWKHSHYFKGFIVV